MLTGNRVGLGLAWRTMNAVLSSWLLMDAQSRRQKWAKILNDPKVLRCEESNTNFSVITISCGEALLLISTSVQYKQVPHQET